MSSQVKDLATQVEKGQVQDVLAPGGQARKPLTKEEKKLLQDNP